MFITNLNPSRRTIYRLWLPVIIIITVVFGVVLVVYEDRLLYQDSLSQYVPSPETSLYLHFNRRGLPADWLDKQVVLNSLIAKFPTFASELSFFQKQNIPELAFVLLRVDDKISSGWLLTAQNENFQPILPSPDWQSVNFSNSYAVSLDSNFLQPITLTQQGNKENLKKHLVAKTNNHNLNNYVYFNNLSELSTGIDEVEGGWEYLKDIVWPTEWLVTLSNGRWDVKVFTGEAKFRLPTFGRVNPRWAEVFWQENIVLYNFDKASLISLWQLVNWPTEIDLAIRQWASKYQLNIDELFGEIDGSVDVAWQGPLGQADSYKNIWWIVRADISSRGQAMVKEALALKLGYLKPWPEETKLPDQTVIKELKVKPQLVDWQEMYINQQLIKVLYFDQDDYFIWWPEGEEVIMSNSLKMVNRYIMNSAVVEGNITCLNQAHQVLLFNFTDFQPILGINRLIIAVDEGESLSNFRICFE